VNFQQPLRAGLNDPARKSKPKSEFPFFGILDPDRQHVRYPFYMYKDGHDPIRVDDEDQEKQARFEGWDNISAATTSNKYLINWFWDLEDMSPRQLQVFAKEEYGVELPIESGQDKLFSCVVDLARNAPQNQNRLILMAHTVQMNYDATLAEIQRMVENPAPGWETETVSFEVEL